LGERGRRLHETGENYKMRSYTIPSPNEMLLKRSNKKDEIGWAYNTTEEKIGFYRF
jgi:hypothetical protein